MHYSTLIHSHSTNIQSDTELLGCIINHMQLNTMGAHRSEMAPHNYYDQVSLKQQVGQLKTCNTKSVLRFCRHVTANHTTLTCLPFWMCDNQGDNVGVSEKCHTGLATSLQLSGNQKKRSISHLVPSACWRQGCQLPEK